MNTQPTQGILSASTERELIEVLSEKGIPYKLVQGVYIHLDGQEISETSAVIPVRTAEELIALGMIFKQESVLFLDANRQAQLIFMDTNIPPIELGRFQSVSKEMAGINRVYTYDATSNTYYICYRHGTIHTN